MANSCTAIIPVVPTTSEVFSRPSSLPSLWSYLYAVHESSCDLKYPSWYAAVLHSLTNKHTQVFFYVHVSDVLECPEDLYYLHEHAKTHVSCSYQEAEELFVFPNADSMFGAIEQILTLLIEYYVHEVYDQVSISPSRLHMLRAAKEKLTMDTLSYQMTHASM